jgi:2-oxoglutarate ferredoxin oxidoreductase subunit alpha
VIRLANGTPRVKWLRSYWGMYADLITPTGQAVFKGEAPIAVIAAATPSDSFDVAIEAVRLAIHYMTPVMLMTDSYLVNAAEPWLLPDPDSLPKFPASRPTDPNGYLPFKRDERGVRPWAVPGTPDMEHRIGGLEKAVDTGNISYDPTNHQEMTDARANKIEAIAADIPEQTVDSGPQSGKMVVVGWGSTHGSIKTAVSRAREEGLEVSHIHVRYLSPLPRKLGQLLSGFEHVLVAEINSGQLRSVLRDKYLVPAEGFNPVTGQLIRVDALVAAIKSQLGE